MSKSLREQLIGAWELIEYCAYLPKDESDKKYPMGPEAKGIIMYTLDGHMSAQLLIPGQKPFSSPGTDDDWAQLGKNYVAYSKIFVDAEAFGGKKRRELLTSDQQAISTLMSKATSKALFLSTRCDIQTFRTLWAIYSGGCARSKKKAMEGI